MDKGGKEGGRRVLRLERNEGEERRDWGGRRKERGGAGGMRKHMHECLPCTSICD